MEDLEKIVEELKFQFVNLPFRTAILVDKKVEYVHLLDSVVWQMKNPDGYRIQLEEVGNSTVSTIFSVVPLDASFQSNNTAKHFETMIFGDGDITWNRYETFDQAVEGHKAAVEYVEKQNAKT